MADRSAVSALSTQSTSRRPAWAERFIEVFAATGNVRLAASAVGVSRDAPYKRAQADPEFAAAWLRAREDAIDMLEAEARRRALGSSDALLVFLLKSERPEKYREKTTVDVRIEATKIALQLGLDTEQVIMEAERLLAASQ